MERSLSGDLLVIVPSRGRPGRLRDMLNALFLTARAKTDVAIAVDGDDPQLDAYKALDLSALDPGTAEKLLAEGDSSQRMIWYFGNRQGLCAWTNQIALAHARDYKFLASFGDDHMPRTRGWDTALIRAIEDMGGTGIAYPWDGVREDVPEAVVMSSNIVTALGWMCLPALSHYWPDNVWADLGRGAGCLRHCRAVWVEHMHPATGKAAADRTYAESSARIGADQAAYAKWRAERMAADVATVAALRAKVAQAA